MRVRLVRLGDEVSKVGADVRAALASWGRGDSVVGGVALLGCRPPDCPEAVDAIVLLPRGLLVVVGVDLPDPAMRLDAPAGGQWKADGWPLVREDGAVNPGSQAVAAAAAVAARLQDQRVEPLPIGTVVAVGPYVARVSQPTSDLARGIRVLHPEPTTLLTATRELAVYERLCPAYKANAVLAALAPDHPPLDIAELVQEGFDGAARPDMAAASTVLIPRLPSAPAPEPTRPAPAARAAAAGKQLAWLPVTAVVLVGLLLVVGIIVAITASGDGGRDTTAAAQSSLPAPPPTTRSTVDGAAYTGKGAIRDTDCATKASGDLQAWLQINGCAGLVRTRYETTVGRDAAAVLVADLSFADEATAAAFTGIAQASGTGTILDASVDGTAWPGGKRPFFDTAAYRAEQSGTRVRIVQAVWLDRSSSPEDPTLGEVASKALELPTA